MKNFSSSIDYLSNTMKVSNGTVNSVTSQKGHSSFDRVKAPLPLVSVEPTNEELELKRRSKFEIRNDPEDPNSTKYSRTIYHIGGSEDVRSVIHWKKELESIREGTGTSNLDQVVRLVSSVCYGAARDSYLSKILERRRVREAESKQWEEANWIIQEEDEDDEDFNDRILEFEEQSAERKSLRLRDHTLALHAVLLDAFPYKVLQKQKRYMRRNMRKPSNMKVRTYAAHLTKINREELPELPPFQGNAQSMSQDEMVEIILNGIPNSWVKEMDKQNFDPEVRTQQELIDFCERMESSEERPDTSNNNRNDSQNGSRKKTKTGSVTHKKSTGKWCVFHETDTHDTSECRQKKFHGQNDDGTQKKSDKSGHSGNKSSNYKKGQYLPRKEVNAIVKQAIKAARKEFHKEDTKKRSAEEANLVEAKPVTNIPKHQFEWNQPLNVGDIVEDDKSAMEAASSMSDMDNQLSEAFDQGDDKDTEYDVQKEQFMLETTGKQAGA